MIRFDDYPEPEIRHDREYQPIWNQELKLRPLRRVVEREEYPVKASNGRKHVWLKDCLECGHIVREPVPWMGEEPPKRRRCKQCADEIIAVSSEGTLQGCAHA